MRQFAVNLSMVFQTLPYLDRFRAAAEAGFNHVESGWPSEGMVGGVTPRDIVRMAEMHQLHVVLLNLPSGDVAAGGHRLAGDPVRAAAFRSTVPVAIDLALRLGCRKLHVGAGNALGPEYRSRQLRHLADRVAFTADMAARAGITVLLEPLNSRDAPHYLLSSTDTALELIERVDRPNARLQLDIYHVAMAGEDPFRIIQRAASVIGHVQIADVPGRHEPGTGSLPFRDILDALEAAGYHDIFGLEFIPVDRAAPNFDCVAQLGGALFEGRARRVELAD